ncbi:MAG: hypothetical protein ACSNEK_03945 [Parachlamydiaceae bacterium]
MRPDATRLVVLRPVERLLLAVLDLLEAVLAPGFPQRASAPRRPASERDIPWRRPVLVLLDADVLLDVVDLLDVDLVAI